MNIFKRFVAWLANLGLGVMLFFLASTVILVFTLANTGFIKKTLATSGFYNNFVPNTLNLVTAQSSNNVGANSDQQLLNKLKPVIEKVATPQMVQKYSEQAIDAAGVWLKSSNQPFVVKLDIKQLKDNLNTQITNYVQDQLNQLPACSNYTVNVDILNATCKPPATISRQQIDQAGASYMASLPFLQSDTLVLGNQTKQDVKSSVPLATAVPRAYKLLSWSPYMFVALGLLCIALIYLLNDDKYRAWRLIGHAFLATGALLVVSGAVSVFFVAHGIKQIGGSASIEQIAFTNQLIIPIAKKVVSTMGYWSLYFGVGYAVVGAACYFISHRLKLLKLKTQITHTDKT